MRGLSVLGVVASAFLFGCAASRDTVSASRDVVGTESATAHGAGAEGYEYVARRPTAVVGLAEARGIEPEIARSAVDRVADALEVCARSEQLRGGPGGAARVVAQIDPRGNVAGTNLRVDPGAAVTGEAALCLVRPTTLLAFPAVDAGARGIAIEAVWGRASSGSR